jgi:hypothetical protein
MAAKVKELSLLFLFIFFSSCRKECFDTVHTLVYTNGRPLDYSESCLVQQSAL